MASVLLDHMQPSQLANGLAEKEMKLRLLQTDIIDLRYDSVYLRSCVSAFYGASNPYTINKIIIQNAKVRNHLEAVFPPSMAEKIMNSLDLSCGEIYYKQFIDQVKSCLVSITRPQIMRLCFNLLDYNDDGKICLQDLVKFNSDFVGTCSEISCDHIDVIEAIKAKWKKYEVSDVPNFNYDRGELEMPVEDKWFSKRPLTKFKAEWQKQKSFDMPAVENVETPYKMLRSENKHVRINS
jgi:hypothetical protein